MTDTSAAPADSALPGWLSSLPPAVQPYAMLARWDRPVGIWLLWLPCVIGLAFARLHSGLFLSDLVWAIVFLPGAVAMRGAGCTWNDITDRDIDAKVERTALRPLPAGLVTLRQAYIFLAAQAAIGFLIWLFLPLDAKILALLALGLVFAYPYMKRIIWWPQAWLGATFNAGVLIGVATAGTISAPAVILYAGLALWTVGYDTIYALQDKEDDALIGVKSTALLFGKRAVLFSFFFYLGAAALIAAAAAMYGAGRLGAVTALAFLLHAATQVGRLKATGNAEALAVFKSNVWAGALVAGGLALAAMVPESKPKSIFADPEIVGEAEPDKVQLPFGLELHRKSQMPEGETWMLSDISRSLAKDGITIPDPDATETDPEE